METQPPKLPPAPPIGIKKSTWAFCGAIVGVLMPALLMLLPPIALKEGSAQIVIWTDLFILFATPVVAAILTISKKTRASGLGLLLASGACWIVVLAIWGGALAYRYFGLHLPP
jgi:hypothetical protein